ncbi:CK5P3 protein, partial [Dicrurus megarhynchus]|nr:CK5P3 protein [Dicrurus megarhynchus]
SPGAEVVPLLRHVGRSGNTTVFQWRTGLEPRRVERPELRQPPEEPPQEDAVGFGGPIPPPFMPSSPHHRGIWDWGRGWDLGAGQGLLGCLGGDAEPVLGGSHPPAPEEVARGSDALTLLENPETRNQFLDELMELELFLAQRLLELEDEADVVAMSQLQLAPPVLQGQSGDRVRAQLATVREMLAQLCSRSVQHLCMILASPR